MSNYTQYAGSRTDTDRRPSTSVWADCKWADMRNGYVGGVTFFEDFVDGGLIVSPTTEAVLGNLPMTGYNSSSAAGTYPALTAGINFDHTAPTSTTLGGIGALRIANTTEDLGGGIRGVQSPFQITADAGKLWYECRIKIASITTLDMSFFAGLCETTYSSTAVVAMSATGVPITTSTGALGDFNLVGFHKPEANTTAFDTSYKANTVTAVEVNSDVGALVANTYVKLGMKFDTTGKKLSFYINGVKQTNTKVIPDGTGTDFPADAALGWIFAMGVGSGAGDNVLTIDWVRIAQEIA